jgi:2-polyprenyl-3-methyl-5-hydroxy-6-metoxy-1,4-benzoquinol methylase
MTPSAPAVSEVANGEGLPQRRAVAINAIDHPRCALCSHEGELLYSGLVDWLYGVPRTWGTRWCSRCQLAWLDPQPVPADVPRLYSRYCTHDAGQLNTWIGRLQEAATECALKRLGYPVKCSGEILPRLLSTLPSFRRYATLSVLGLPSSETGSLLDVGCGNGQFISRMRSFGWTVSGIDPDPAAVALGSKQGLHIRTGMVADLPETERYDVITLSHVVEHVSDPVTLLRECAKRLQPNGRLILATPNINSLGHSWFERFWRGLEVPRHFIIFSPAAFHTCVARAGLVVESLTTETRLAQMIYKQSSNARAGATSVGEATHTSFGTKLAARLFHIIEKIVVAVGRNSGEEIFCVCAKPVASTAETEKS